MNRRRIVPTIVSLVAILAVAGGCTTGSRAPGSPAPASPAPTAGVLAPSAGDRTPGAPTAATPESTPVILGDIADLLVVRAATPTPNAALAVIDPVGSRVLFELPDGIVSRDWSRLASVTVSGASTQVQVTTPEGGDTPVRIEVPGAWRLPTVGVAREASGLSAAGTRLVLEEAVDAAHAAAPDRTRFAIVTTSGSVAPRIVTLDGAFGFDALSPDGSWLYLLEYQAGGDPTRYQVRRLERRHRQARGRGDRRQAQHRRADERVRADPGDGDGRLGLHAVSRRRGCIRPFARHRHRGCVLHRPARAPRPSTPRPMAAGASSPTRPATGCTWSTRPGGRSARSTSPTSASWQRQAGERPGRPPRQARECPARRWTRRPEPGWWDLFVVDTTGVAVVRVADLVTTGHLGGNGVFRSIAVGSDDAVYAVDEAGRVVRLDPGPATSAPISDGTYSSIVAAVPMR